MYQSPGAWGQVAFVFAKLWILLLPVLWTIGIDREMIKWSRPKFSGLGLAARLGAAIAVVIMGAYFFIARDWMDGSAVRELAEKNGFAHPMVYAGIAVYWCVVNSLLEEYVWRWFALRKCVQIFGERNGIAIALSSLLFTLHHIFALAAQFDWRVTVIGSLGVFVGGVMWGWLYQKYRSIWPGYVCHVLADVPIFVIGWLIVR